MKSSSMLFSIAALLVVVIFRLQNIITVDTAIICIFLALISINQHDSTRN